MLVYARAVLWMIMLAILLQGCAAPGRLAAVPVQDTTRAEIPGIPNARYWVDADIEPFIRDAVASAKREAAYLARTDYQGPLPPVNFLAVSGGGDDGAFGAGLLVGWTQTGTRPEFKGVTGVSTGALIAPFAFLGPGEDHTLREVYTTIDPQDVLKPRGLLAALTSDAMADNHPLWELISRYINAELLARIAAEYEDKGRLLLIGTTNLDARRPVIWNMGAIAAAARENPRALDLFRRIMLASAAIPGAFPPTMIDVEVDGQPYQEMHVDGGAMAQVFLYPPRMFETARREGIKIPPRERSVYVIRNARLDPQWASVERSTLSIAGRAISSLIQTQGIGDLYRIYLTAQQDGLDYHLAYIGADFKAVHKEDFDTEYMQALFDYGYALGRKGYPWRKTPPGLTVQSR
ncbi:MAG: patatin-like phospholipase family protein [Candidatus Competibacteraceae bacterium]|nr:patatin-like phospholipase family protein [Candidatus Competibacteraceae bacterium]